MKIFYLQLIPVVLLPENTLKLSLIARCGCFTSLLSSSVEAPENNSVKRIKKTALSHSFTLSLIH